MPCWPAASTSPLACTSSSGGLNVAGDGPVSLDDVDLDAALVFLEVRRDPRIQLEEATRAAQAFLVALGVDLTRAGMADTPARMARAYVELFSARPFQATHFP